MALAMTGGSFVTATSAVAPTSATSITLDVPTKNVTISPTPGNTSVNHASHTVNVTTSNSTGYHLTLSSTDNAVDMVLTNTNSDTNKRLSPVGSNGILSTNQWGYTTETVTDSNKDSSIWLPLQPKNKPANIANTTTPSGTNHDGNTSDNHTVTYGAKVATNTEAGEYKKEVVYTATTNPPPAPTVTGLILNDTVMDGETKKFAINGTNLSTVNKVIFCEEGDEIGGQTCRETTDITIYKDSDKKDTVLSFVNPMLWVIGDEEPVYNLYVEGDGGISPDPVKFYVREPSQCIGSSDDDCQVDYDDHMLPVYWDEDNTMWIDLDAESVRHYNYNSKEWANAITLRDDFSKNYYCIGREAGADITSANYREFIDGGGEWLNGDSSCNRPSRKVTPLAYWLIARDTADSAVGIGKSSSFLDDILGYWVYIPRYAYEVQRRDATDKFVLDEYELPDGSKIKNDFIIKFEKSTDAKKVPVACTSNQEIKTAAQMWKDGHMPTINDNQANLVLAKDYRTGCGLNRKYGDATGTTWATHPAFTFGNKELNGIWVGKFETTGSSAEPTIKPNNYHKVATVGEAFDIAKSIGTTDNVAKNYGNGGSTFGKHNLQSATTHMLKNSEWGAATYLSSSMYGAGVNNVQINASEDNGDSSNDGDGRDSASITGCGPSANGNTSAYECSGKTDHRYQSAIGQLASTTGNVYGIYDMAGGAWEYVMGSRSEAAEEATGSGYITGSVKPPYVDLYPTASAKGKFGSPATWSGDTSMEYLYNNDQCEWNTCGGQALHETKIVQSISSRNQSWGNSYADFVHSSHPWFYRGGGWRNASSASLYYLHYGYGGYDGDDDGFRVSLLVTQ